MKAIFKQLFTPFYNMNSKRTRPYTLVQDGDNYYVYTGEFIITKGSEIESAIYYYREWKRDWEGRWYDTEVEVELEYKV
tara:strand:- start:98 stop:334 length:237 start_codon:yes stop_codon:yes gene_type:complete